MDGDFTQVGWPSLEFQHVFDLCAVEAHRAGGRVAILANSPFYVRELGRRMRGLEVVEERGARVEWAVWAASPTGDVAAMGTALRAALAPDARLYVIAAGLTAAALPEWREREDRLARLWRVRGWLRRVGLRVEMVYGFHGPASIAWGYISRLPAWLGRPDLTDRALFQMRASYVTRGWGAMLAPLAVMVARRAGA